MFSTQHRWLPRAFRLALTLAAGFILVFITLSFLRSASLQAQAAASSELFRAPAMRLPLAPIPPPEGYPKLNTSSMVVSPTLAHTGGAMLYYQIAIRNTGAYTASQVSLYNSLPLSTTYNNDGWSSDGVTPVYTNGVLTWDGTVGFDATVWISYSVQVSATFEGLVVNTAVIDQPDLASPVTVTAKTVVTDVPIFALEKSSTPAKPGANKDLTYTIQVTNNGQPADSLPITVTDQVPLSTTVTDVGPDGTLSPAGDVVTWTRSVNLATGASTFFTFTVNIDDVVSGTVVANNNYQVTSQPTGVVTGTPYTVTVIDPIFSISKDIWPNPPGSNREATYTITVLNTGSLATDLVITDELPSGVTYVSGGSLSGGVVSWSIPSLDTGESTQVNFTVYIPDIAAVDLSNGNYGVCSAEGVCQAGPPLTSTVTGPTFAVSASLDPIAKKPGGGTGPVTPTLTLENLGPGNALGARATLLFSRISVSLNDLRAIPARGQFTGGPTCGDNCVSYFWTGDLAYGQMITFTTYEGQSTIGGEEGTIYTATLAVTDTLGSYTTEPVSATATGHVTHFANLVPYKQAPKVVGAGEMMTYTIEVFNSGLSTDVPPYPALTETVPASVTLVSASDGGVSQTVNGRTVVSWTLPAMSPGDAFFRYFAVRVDEDLVSGTLIVNDDYRTSWYDIEASGILSTTGEPITTVVREVGLIDSFKVVTPTIARPGPDNILTYELHLVNSSSRPATGVQVFDRLPWQYSTYQRDATASSGQVVSDIVSLEWSGDVAPFSSEVITFSVLVDDGFEGAITNTAVITSPDLRAEVVVSAVAYITNQPVLRISKTASPSPVRLGGELLYTIQVTNLGQQATNLVITDTLPFDTAYVNGSASASGQLVGNTIRWQLPVLLPGQKYALTFRVQVQGAGDVANLYYGVTSAEGASATGAPVITKVYVSGRTLFAPVIRR